jgi:nucleotide-binding universal stress UspA family protein
MSINTIVAPMTGGPTDGAALDAALAMAGPTNAHIHAIFLHPDPKRVAIPQVGEGMTAAMIDTLIEAAEQRIQSDRGQAQASHDSWRKANDIVEADTPGPRDSVTAQLGVVQGEPNNSLAKIGRTADVVCMTQPSDNDDPELANLVTTALMDTGKLLFLAPNGGKCAPVKSVAVAWNGSREAARAVALAMPMLERADLVTVLAGTSDMLTPAEVNAFVDSLKWHGVNAKPRMFTMNGDQAGRLQAEAMDAGAQVLVLGAYSHSRMREFVFGGVTDDILNAAQMPVLLAH